MIVFPNAKINLGLNVLRKREDGFHDLETLFYPVPLCDVLEIVIVKKNSSGKNDNIIQIETYSGFTISYSSSGLPVSGETKNNLCIRACLAYDKNFGLPGDVAIHLHKVIPMGAGLGGGSSDAAYTLNVLNQLAGLRATESELLKLAAELGSDCSFFIRNTPAFAQGRGELLNASTISLAGYHLVIIMPDIHVGTAAAFNGITPRLPVERIEELTKLDVPSWKDRLVNDFERSVFSNNPKIASIKAQLYELGAVYASMTGSGAAVYGLFKKSLPDENFNKNNFYFSCVLK